ncbi:MAG: SUMF1/EgtB/PvdO family nonheme iron enzyme [Ruminococcus sp.]|nr:SUMF1/EgtB/PvdO family nonheme iron enzyme [Ruminococcus sp.]
MADNFDISGLALESIFPTNHILTDDKGLPSVMVYIPKFKMSEVIDGASDSTHPAFIVDGVEISGIYISKYQNITYNSRAYSLPCKDPASGVKADTARTYCESKGTGWHLMSAMEWGAIALWCMKNGWLPYGNNNYGLDSRETFRKGIPTNTDSSGNICRIATGSGPVEYSHNKQLDGIYDLNGNILEWADGMRFVYGELQILANNNSADSANSKLDTSSAWMAIDGTTGELIEPDGSGTTSNSLKLDYISSKWTWITGTISGTKGTYYCKFGAITTDDTVCDEAKEILYALALLPDDTTFDYEGNCPYLKNDNSESLPARGGAYCDGKYTGVFFANLNRFRYSYGNVGFRCAYYEAN